MRLLRHTLVARVLAAGLLVGLGLGVASPLAARSAEEWATDEPALTPDIFGAALAEVGPEATPQALAEAVARAMGDDALSPDAILQALYGHLFRAFQFDLGTQAVLAVTHSAAADVRHTALGSDAVLAEAQRRYAPAVEHADGPAVASLLPLRARPAVQALGP